MRRIVTAMAAGAALLMAWGAITPLSAQCMGCVSSSACGESTTRGNCSAECVGTVCACSDTKCRETITVAPVGAEQAVRFAVRASGGEPQDEAVGVLVRDCDGTVELLVYSGDGSQLIESRLLARGSELLTALLPAPAEVGSD
jgi:hypothetical protein